MNKTDEFLELYNELDSLLRKKYKEIGRTSSVIMRYINELNRSGNSNLIKISKKLNMIRSLRNDLIHEYDNNIDHFIEISDEAIKFLKMVVDKLRNPTTAKGILTPTSLLYTVKEDDNPLILDIMVEMRQRGHSQVPVLNAKNVVRGVFSPNALFSYIEKNKVIDIDNLRLVDIWDNILINNHFSETYAFIAQNMSETDVDKLFSENYEKNRKLAACFVTERGRDYEPLLGLIVLGDIIKN